MKEEFSWKTLWDLVKHDIVFIVVAGLCSTGIGIINIWIPLAVGNIVNELSTIAASLDEEFFWKLIKPGYKLILQFMIQELCYFINSIVWSTVEERIYYRISTKLFKSMVQQEMGFFDHHQTGELMNRLTNDSRTLLNAINICLSDGIRNLIQVIGSIVLMFINAPKLTVTVMILIPPLYKWGKGNPLISPIETLSKKAHEQSEKAMAIADEVIGNMRHIRSLAMEERKLRLFEEQMEYGRKLKQSFYIRLNIYHSLWNIMISGAFLGVGYYGCRLVSQGQLSPGVMIGYAIYAETLRVSLNCFFYQYKASLEGKVGGARVFEYMNRIPSMPLQGGVIIPLEDVCGDIRFDDVTFSYPTQPTRKILKNFSLTVPRNQTIVLSSKSGGGKSTIASLLVRLYDVDKGRITIDGTDIRDLDAQWLRGKLIGYINQEPILFATSILENIRYGNPEATDDEIKAAAKLANADEFIREFPKGYDTLIGERGVTVSGGQKQRIAIARAFVKNPRILILDEATSALDGESENLVLDALDSLKKDRTVLVMTHRSSPIQHADLVSTIGDGILIETMTSQAFQAKNFFRSSNVITATNNPLLGGSQDSIH